ncbi:MAG: hypothetical protein IT294_14355 [Deltaproteobacteria bacterium]|nr:hypothetical protein [Deltaproteobacteria bacterium]
MAEQTRSRHFTSPLETAIVLPEQWFTRRRALPEPERRLRLALLDDALRYHRDYAGATERRARVLYEDAAEWIASRDRSEPFAFENVCDALGLDASAIRRALRRDPASRPRVAPRPPHRRAA